MQLSLYRLSDEASAMQEKFCGHCGGSQIQTKEIEIRHINSNTMALASRQKVIELFCKACGWVSSIEKTPAFR
jgi:hypothetical protein